MAEKKEDFFVINICAILIAFFCFLGLPHETQERLDTGFHWLVSLAVFIGVPVVFIFYRWCKREEHRELMEWTARNAAQNAHTKALQEAAENHREDRSDANFRIWMDLIDKGNSPHYSNYIPGFD